MQQYIDTIMKWEPKEEAPVDKAQHSLGDSDECHSHVDDGGQSRGDDGHAYGDDSHFYGEADSDDDDDDDDESDSDSDENDRNSLLTSC